MFQLRRHQDQVNLLQKLLQRGKLQQKMILKEQETSEKKSQTPTPIHDIHENQHKVDRYLLVTNVLTIGAIT